MTTPTPLAVVVIRTRPMLLPSARPTPTPVGAASPSVWRLPGTTRAAS